MRHRVLVPSLVCAAILAACDSGRSPQPAARAPAGSGGTGAAAPAWLLAQAPADAVGVAAVKAGAKEGDTVTIRGRIGGRADPMTPGSPIFVIMDPSIPSCRDNPEDRCATPWDYCCETPETKAANNATIQVVDASGAPITDSLEAAGFAPLDEVIAVGVVGPRPDPSVLVVRATALHRVTP